jgi:hypothetical protein
MTLRAVVLVLLVAGAGVVPTLPRWPRRIGALGLAALSLWWLRLDSTMEGGTLHQISTGRGITVADFVSVGGFLVALYALALRRR